MTDAGWFEFSNLRNLPASPPYRQQQQQKVYVCVDCSWLVNRIKRSRVYRKQLFDNGDGTAVESEWELRTDNLEDALFNKQQQQHPNDDIFLFLDVLPSGCVFRTF